MDPKQTFLQKMVASIKNAGKETYVRTPDTPKSRYMTNATTSGEFTMYNPHPAQTDSRPREMASGKEIYDGAIAAGDRGIPLGTKVYVPQLDRTFIVEDRMNKRYDDPKKAYFDIPTYGSTSKESKAAKEFGRRKLDFIITGHDGREDTRIQAASPSYNPLIPNPAAVTPVQ